MTELTGSWYFYLKKVVKYYIKKSKFFTTADIWLDFKWIIWIKIYTL